MYTKYKCLKEMSQFVYLILRIKNTALCFFVTNVHFNILVACLFFCKDQSMT